MQQSTDKPTNIRWGVFALACGASWLLYLHRYTFALIKPRLAAEWGLGKDELGQLDGAFSLCYTVFQVPFGIAADVWGVHAVLTALIIVWSMGMGLHAGAGSSAMLWYGRALLGVGQSAGYAALNRISRQWFPPDIRTTLQGFVGVVFGRAGGLSANLLFGTVMLGMLGLDWRTAVWIFCGIGLLFAGLFFAGYRNTPSEHPRVNPAEALLITGDDGPPAGSTATALNVRETLRCLTPRGVRNLAALSVQTTLSTFADNIYSNWIPLFLWEVHHLQFQEMGVYSSLPLFGGAVAGAVGGLLNDVCLRYTGSRRWARSGVGACGKGFAGVLLFLALVWYDQPYLFCGMLFFVKLVGDWSLPTTWGVVSDIGGKATASVYAINNAVAGIGLIAAPIVLGKIAENYGWRLVFLTVAVTYVLCALSWLWIDCTVPLIRDGGETAGETSAAR